MRASRQQLHRTWPRRWRSHDWLCYKINQFLPCKTYLTSSRKLACRYVEFAWHLIHLKWNWRPDQSVKAWVGQVPSYSGLSLLVLIRHWSMDAWKLIVSHGLNLAKDLKPWVTWKRLISNIRTEPSFKIRNHEKTLRNSKMFSESFVIPFLCEKRSFICSQ